MNRFELLYMQVPAPSTEIGDPKAPCAGRPNYLKPHSLVWHDDHHARCRYCDGVYFPKELNHVY